MPVRPEVPGAALSARLHLPGSYLVLETTNRCSLACVHCSVSEDDHPHHARTGFLGMATVNALFQDLVRVRARFDALILFWLGEPLLHRDFGAIHAAALRVANEHGTFGSVEVHTNATHLTPDKVRAALNEAATPQTWHLTLDGTTAATYRAVKGRDPFDKVEGHVRHFLGEKARLGARWPRAVLQFIVGRNNAHEAVAFRERWGRELDRLGLPWRAAAQEVPQGEDTVIFFRQLDAPTREAQEAENATYRATMATLGLTLPRAERSPAQLADKASAPCGCLWKAPTVGWDGTVTTCTRDNRFENALGNLHTTPFSELWWGSRMREVRSRAGAGRDAGLAACVGCFVPQSANSTAITPGEVAAWQDLAAPGSSPCPS